MSAARGRRGLSSISGGLAQPTHRAEPKPGTIRSAKLGASMYATVMEYPHEAECLHCPQIIRLGQEMPIGPIGTWQHTGRKPGESLR